MVSFRGRAAPAWVLDGLREGTIAAVCLFAHNVASPARLRELTRTLHTAAREGGHPPPLVGIDQEGGQLMAVTGGATELPGNMALGGADRADLAERAGRVLGHELLAMGCTVDFAPVLDLAHHPGSPVVGPRSFGDDPGKVGRLGAATVRGLQSTGVIATAKHFPGHGATGADSHHAAPRIDRDLHELMAEELAPFRAAVAAGVGAIMTAHVTYPALDDVPATLSRRILTGLLREEMGFGGLVVSDAMDMGAVAHLSPERRCAAALAAGADLVLLGHLEDQPALIRALEGSFDDGARARIDTARRGLPSLHPPLDRVGCREHRELAHEIADAAVTALRNHGLPLRPAPDEYVTVLTVSAGDLTPADTSSAAPVRLAAQVAERHDRVRATTLPYRVDRSTLARILADVPDDGPLVVATVDVANDPSQRELLRDLGRRGRAFVHVALRTPYDLLVAAHGGAALCAYGAREANTEAIVRVLFGEIEPRGDLPFGLASRRGGDRRDGAEAGSRT